MSVGLGRPPDVSWVIFSPWYGGADDRACIPPPSPASVMDNLAVGQGFKSTSTLARWTSPPNAGLRSRTTTRPGPGPLTL